MPQILGEIENYSKRVESSIIVKYLKQIALIFNIITHLTFLFISLLTLSLK